MNKTENTQATAEQFMKSARHVADLARGLNTSYGAFMNKGTFYAYDSQDAQDAIAGLQELIAHRELEILQAQEALEAYEKCIAEGGVAAYQIMRNEAYERMARGEN